MEDVAARDLVAEVEELLGELEALPDAAAREKATAVVGALLELYGAGLERMVEEIAERDEEGELAEALAGDDLVSHLLLLHGLHPVPLEERVQGALDGVRPYLESHGGDVELLSAEGGVVRLRLQGSCSGCPSSTMTLKLAIEDAIHKAAPDVEEIEAEGAVEPAAPPLLQIEVAGAGAGGAPAGGAPPAGDGAWATAGGLPELANGRPLVKPVAGDPVLFLRLNGATYAYRPACPGCGGSLDGAELRGAELACPGCGHRFDAIRAGRCLDEPQLHLEPVPLVTDDDGLVRVALGQPA